MLFRPGKVSITMKIIIWLCATAILGTMFLRWMPSRTTTTHAERHNILKDDRNKNDSAVDTACILPNLPFNDAPMMKFFKKLSPIDCQSHHEDLVYVDSGTLRFSKPVSPKTKCKMFPVIRGPGDYKISYGQPVLVKDNMPLIADFFKINCTENGRKIYENVQLGVHYNRTVKARIRSAKLPSDGLQLSVAFLGFDSMSRMSWLRRLPKTRKFTLEKLGAIELEGYGIMGDGTPAALFPILTGKHEQELPEARRHVQGAKTVDGFPWIWKEFEKNGYVTSWAESSPSIATFNYRLLGFEHQPTDFFLRPFFMAADPMYKNFTSGCHGGLRHHQVWFNFIRELFKMYKDDPKFMFQFYDALSHGDNNPITMCDDDLYELLSFLKTGGYLKDTLLVLFADHGCRFSQVRAHLSGKLEERLPYISLSFPEWFHIKHPDIIRNVKTNIKRLTTPMDVHEMLKDILHFTGSGVGDVGSRGISLFKEIPKDRTCAHADVAPHWCACMSWTKASAGDADVVQAAQNALNFINELTQPYREYCSLLSIQTIEDAYRSQVDDKLLRFKETSGDRGLNPILSAKTKAEKMLYQITFITAPSEGEFEITMERDLIANKFNLNRKAISRINKYGHASDCVQHKTRELRPFCYCKK